MFDSLVNFFMSTSAVSKLPSDHKKIEYPEIVKSSGIKNNSAAERIELNIVLFSLDTPKYNEYYVGKSSLLCRYLHGSYDDNPRIAMESVAKHVKKTRNGDVPINIMFADLKSKDRLRNHGSAYASMTVGILCHPVRAEFDESAWKELQRKINEYNNGKAIIILAGTCDDECDKDKYSTTIPKKFTKAKGEEIVKKYNFDAYMTCSAKEGKGVGVNELFERAIELAKTQHVLNVNFASVLSVLLTADGIIDLSGKKITDAQAIELAQIICQAPSTKKITQIFLCNNEISNLGAKALLKAVCSKPEQRIKIHLDGNINISEDLLNDFHNLLLGSSIIDNDRTIGLVVG